MAYVLRQAEEICEGIHRRNSAGQTTFNFPPVSRNTDPITSHIAEQEVTNTGVRGTQTQEVYNLVKEFPLKTAIELSVRSDTLDRYQVQRRLSDLENMGKIRKGPKRFCNVSGRLSVTWEGMETV